MNAFNKYSCQVSSQVSTRYGLKTLIRIFKSSPDNLYVQPVLRTTALRIISKYIANSGEMWNDSVLDQRV